MQDFGCKGLRATAVFGQKQPGTEQADPENGQLKQPRTRECVDPNPSIHCHVSSIGSSYHLPFSSLLKSVNSASRI